MDQFDLSEAAYLAGVAAGLIMLLIAIVCMVGIFIFGLLTVLFGIIEGTSHVPTGQHRSMRKTFRCVIGFAISLGVLVLLLIGYGIVSVILGF